MFQEDNEFYKKWSSLLKTALNGVREVDGPRIVNITVAEVLGVGYIHIQPPEVAVVKDTHDKIWLIPETSDDNDDRALVSRHNVRVGMKLQLKIWMQQSYETKVYCLSEEVF